MPVILAVLVLVPVFIFILFLVFLLLLVSTPQFEATETEGYTR